MVKDGMRMKETEKKMPTFVLTTHKITDTLYTIYLVIKSKCGWLIESCLPGICSKVLIREIAGLKHRPFWKLRHLSSILKTTFHVCLIVLYPSYRNHKVMSKLHACRISTCNVLKLLKLTCTSSS
jgi:hypothetical protein